MEEGARVVGAQLKRAEEKEAQARKEAEAAKVAMSSCTTLHIGLL